jgi:hypothetical protein
MPQGTPHLRELLQNDLDALHGVHVRLGRKRQQQHDSAFVKDQGRDSPICKNYS